VYTQAPLVPRLCLREKGLSQIQLRFDREDIIIEVGEGINHYGIDFKKTWSYSKGRDAFSLNGLLEVSVTNASVDADKNLSLYFQNGERIEIVCKNVGLGESYVIYKGKDFQVI
jgi:hypothetical protein